MLLQNRKFRENLKVLYFIKLCSCESKYQITNFCPIFVIGKQNRNEKFKIFWNVLTYLCLYLIPYTTIFSEIKHFLIILIICTLIFIYISYFNYNICGNYIKIYIKIQLYKIYLAWILEIWVYIKIQMVKYEYIRIHLYPLFLQYSPVEHDPKKNLVKSSSTCPLLSPFFQNPLTFSLFILLL